MEKITYFLKEGFKNIWVNRLMSFASVSVLTICLILLGTSLLVSMNIKNLIYQIEDQNQIMVYLKNDLSQTEIANIGTSLQELDNVKSTVFISKQQALDIQKKELGNNADLLAGLDKDNPLPNTYQVSLKDMSKYTQTVSEINKLSGIGSIKQHVDLAQKLTHIENVISIAGIWLFIILAVVSLFIISYTIKLAMYVRKREINIMKFVGATDGFIRWPFVVEGVIIGLISGAIAVLVQWYVYSRLIRGMFGVLGIMKPLVFSSVAPLTAFGFIFGGIAVGIAASLVSVRKYLKV